MTTTTTTTLPNGNRAEHYKTSDGFESWKEFNTNNNEIHYKDSTGHECWKEYDKNNNLSHYKNSKGYEIWNEYDENNNQIHYKNSDGVESWHHNGVEITKEEFNKIHNTLPLKTRINNMKQEMILIYVAGGVVHEVRTTNEKNPPEVKIFDVDNLMETKSSKWIDSTWKKLESKFPTSLSCFDDFE